MSPTTLVAAVSDPDADMTLGEAMDIRRAGSWACACVGSTPWCYCRRVWLEVEQLHRGAHITANLMLRAGRLRSRPRNGPRLP